MIRLTAPLLLTLLLVTPCLAQQNPPPPLPPKPKAPTPAKPTPPDPASPTALFSQKLQKTLDHWKGTHKVATLGLIRDVVELSLSVGGKLYDKGDVAGCHQIYSSSVQLLVKNFGNNQQSSQHARNALLDLVAAHRRAEQTKASKLKAWRIRFAFDKVLIDYDQIAAYMQKFNQLGHKYCKIGLYEDAMIAFNSAAGLQEEILLIKPSRMSVGFRETGIAMSRALIGLGQFKKASQAIQNAMKAMPDWPTYSFKAQSAFPNGKTYQTACQKLAGMVMNNANADIDLVFLLAHELFFNGQSNQAFDLLGKILGAQPQHYASRCFYELSPNSARGKRIAAALKRFVSVNAKDRQEATALLEREGRWSLPFLRSLAGNQQNPAELRQRAANLIKAMGG